MTLCAPNWKSSVNNLWCPMGRCKEGNKTVAKTNNRCCMPSEFPELRVKWVYSVITMVRQLICVYRTFRNKINNINAICTPCRIQQSSLMDIRRWYRTWTHQRQLQIHRIQIVLLGVVFHRTRRSSATQDLRHAVLCPTSIISKIRIKWMRQLKDWYIVSTLLPTYWKLIQN